MYLLEMPGLLYSIDELTFIISENINDTFLPNILDKLF